MVLVTRTGPIAAAPAPTPIDLAELASYPPVASAPPDESVTLTGAGDIASCARTDDEATAALLEDVPGWVFTAGDNAYESGTTEEFEQCYDPSWGAYRDRTFPAIGNHDAVTPGRQGYFDYFGSRAGDRRVGWYATTLGAWRLIVLDSTCVDAGGCGPDTDQGRWLAAELDAHQSDCTLAIWHHPRYSTGSHGPTVAVAPFWDALYAAGADLVVNGHDHDYERFVPVDPAGQPDAERGIRQIVAGTGGAALRSFEHGGPEQRGARRVDGRRASARPPPGCLRLGVHPGGGRVVHGPGERNVPLNADFGPEWSASLRRGDEAELDRWLGFALDLCDTADAVALGAFRRDLVIETKPDRTFVTQADRGIEQELRTRIADAFPDHGIVGEEFGTSDPDASVRWYLDPIDGTHNFMRGVPLFGTLIGIERDGELQVGVVSAPALGHPLVRAAGRGSLGGGPRAVRRLVGSRAGSRSRRSRSVPDMQLLYGSARDVASSGKAPGFDALIADAWRDRGLGDFWGYTLVAEGAAEAMVEADLSSWDMAAPFVVVEEAGGRMTDLSGRRTIHERSALATNGILHEEVLARLQG